jgi:hypothetical protein
MKGVPMLSFFGEQCLKDAVVARVKEHQRLDQIIQGTYWDGQRGCAIGCVLHSGDHMAYERQLGLPVFLAYMDEHIFESMLPVDARKWPLRFIEAVPVGVDLELVFPRFMHWLLSDPDGMRQHADARTLPIIESLVSMYARRINGIPFDVDAAASAARSAARSARSAAWSAESAAWSAAESAAWSAAWSAARSAASVAWSAESAAESAAWSAARSAARSAAESAAASAAESAAESAAWSAAWSAARSARSAAWSAAESAAMAYIHRQADMLISILQSYESVPVLVYAPCEERILIP